MVAAVAAVVVAPRIIVVSMVTKTTSINNVNPKEQTEMGPPPILRRKRVSV